MPTLFYANAVLCQCCFMRVCPSLLIFIHLITVYCILHVLINQHNVQS
jgi:hypothetical protein